MLKDIYWSEDRKLLWLIKLAVLLLVPIVLYLIPPEWIKNQRSICLYKFITGRECYGCGMTRAVFSAIHFHFSEAFYYNKLFLIVLPLLIYIWVKNLVHLRPGKKFT